MFPRTPATLLAKMAVRVTGRNDESMWTRLFELYDPVIQNFARLKGWDSESEDISQEIFFKLVEVFRKGKYRLDAGRFRSYLTALIKRELVDMWRKRQSRGGGAVVPFDEQMDALPVVDSDTAALMDMKWRLARHQAAVDHVLSRTALSAKTKAVYRLYVLEEKPLAEVALRFSVSDNYVAQVKRRVGKMISAVESEICDE